MTASLQVLFLEGETNLEQMLKLHLEQEGIQIQLQRVSSRSSFELAISTARFDVYLLNPLSTPLDGIEAIKLIRQHEKLAPVIMLSDRLDEELIVSALSSGACNYVLKQNLGRLADVIKQATSEHRLRLNQFRTKPENNSILLDLTRYLPGASYQFMRDREGVFSLPEVSPEFESMMGITRSEAVQNARVAFDKVHPDDLSGMMHSIEQSAHSLSTWEYEFRIRKQNDDYFWAKGISTPFTDEQGSIIWSGYLLDINHLKRTELSLQYFKNTTQVLLETVNDLFYRTDKQDYLTLVSSSLHNLLGYEPGTLIEQNMTGLYSQPESHRTLLSLLRKNNGSVTDYQTTFKNNAGHNVPVLINARFYYEPGNKEAVGIEGTARPNSLQGDNFTTNGQQADKAHNLLNLITGKMPVVLYTLNIKDGKFETEWVSTNLFEMFGYSFKDVCVENWWQKHLHPDDRDKALANSRLLFETGTLTHEYRFICANGEYKWILDRLVLVKDKSGAPTHINGCWVDITDRRNMENSLHRSEERFRRSQVFANIGTWDWDIQTGELYWSERIAPLFGYPEGRLETTYENFLAAVHPDDRQSVIDAVNACVQDGIEYNIEHRCVWPDGSIRWLLEKGDVTRTIDGTPLHMLGVVQDITARKEAELLLHENREKLGGLYELSPLGIALTDMQGHYLEFNEAFCNICGYSAEELKHLDYWTLTPREFEKQEQQQLELLNNTGRYGPYEKFYRQKNGNLIPIRLNGIRIEDKNGKPLIWSIIEDITDSKQAEQALISAKNEAENANRAKSEFLSSMSHELRTPLNAIIGFSQLLEFDENLTKDQQMDIHEVFKAGNHLLDLINDILDLSKIESGRLDLNIDDVNLHAVIKECVTISHALAEPRNITIQTVNSDLPDDLLVRADRTRLKQVIINLLSNAIKYNRENGEVIVSSHFTHNNLVRISIRDTGEGIPEDKMSDLFTPFNRLGAENSNIQGTGIGLIITRNLVEQMGTRLEIESTPGQGSTFSFNLSYLATDFAKKPLKSDENMDITETSMNQHKTIIYIEDNPTNLKLVEQLIKRKEGIRILSAMEPVAGIELISQEKPDLILLDINLPTMNGYEVLEKLQANPQTQQIPVVAVSANAMLADIEKGQQAGFTDYITKPINIPEFYSKLDELLA